MTKVIEAKAGELHIVTMSRAIGEFLHTATLDEEDAALYFKHNNQWYCINWGKLQECLKLFSANER